MLYVWYWEHCTPVNNELFVQANHVSGITASNSMRQVLQQFQLPGSIAADLIKVAQGH